MPEDAKHHIERVLYSTSPAAFDSMVSFLARRRLRKWENGEEYLKTLDAWVARFGLEVKSGPFAGMKYGKAAAGSAFLPKLIGSYERELQRVVAPLLTVAYDAVIDVGSAEGYYAAGFALRGAGKSVMAFDIDPEAQMLCGRMARLNGVSGRLSVQAACTPEGLQAILRQNPRSLVICDCEGYEKILLDPSAVPGLRGCDVLVELHDCFDDTITPTVLPRFADTHEVQVIDSEPRRPEDYPDVQFLTPIRQELALKEFRPEGQQWAFMGARAVK